MGAEISSDTPFCSGVCRGWKTTLKPTLLNHLLHSVVEEAAPCSDAGTCFHMTSQTPPFWRNRLCQAQLLYIYTQDSRMSQQCLRFPCAS